MVLYNTVMGVAAGAALVLVPVLGRKLYRRERVAAEGWALCFAVLGALLAVLGGLMSVTWPLKAKEQVNILFGEPTLFLGLLLLAAAAYLWRHAPLVTDTDDAAMGRMLMVLEPASWLVFALGVILLACTVAIFRFDAIGAAPAQEPIMGIFADHPGIENTILGSLYGLAAIGSLLAPLATRNLGGPAARVAGWCMAVGGALLLVYSAMNYYTHIGLLVRTAKT